MIKHLVIGTVMQPNGSFSWDGSYSCSYTLQFNATSQSWNFDMYCSCLVSNGQGKSQSWELGQGQSMQIL